MHSPPSAPSDVIWCKIILGTWHTFAMTCSIVSWFLWPKMSKIVLIDTFYHPQHEAKDSDNTGCSKPRRLNNLLQSAVLVSPSPLDWVGTRLLHVNDWSLDKLSPINRQSWLSATICYLEAALGSQEDLPLNAPRFSAWSQGSSLFLQLQEGLGWPNPIKLFHVQSRKMQIRNWSAGPFQPSPGQSVKFDAWPK